MCPVGQQSAGGSKRGGSRRGVSGDARDGGGAHRTSSYICIRKSNAGYFGNLSIELPFGFHNPGIRARGGKKTARQPGVLWKWVRGRQRGGEQKLPALSDLLPLPNFSPPPPKPPSLPHNNLLLPSRPAPHVTEIIIKHVIAFHDVSHIFTDVSALCLNRRQILKGDALSKPNTCQT